jgi:hypothetical protein
VAVGRIPIAESHTHPLPHPHSPTRCSLSSPCPAPPSTPSRAPASTASLAAVRAYQPPQPSCFPPSWRTTRRRSCAPSTRCTRGAAAWLVQRQPRGAWRQFGPFRCPLSPPLGFVYECPPSGTWWRWMGPDEAVLRWDPLWLRTGATVGSHGYGGPLEVQAPFRSTRCLPLPCLALPCPALPCLAPSCPILPYLPCPLSRPTHPVRSLPSDRFKVCPHWNGAAVLPRRGQGVRSVIQ